MFTDPRLVWLNPRISIEGECWRWIGSISTDGYAKCFSKEHTGKKSVKVSRYLETLLKGPISPGIVIRHKCLNKDCINPDHLERGTSKQNAEDRNRDGTALKGSKNHKAKLTDTQVLEIRSSDLSIVELVERYGISKPQVHSIRRGKSWRHLGGPFHYNGPPKKLTPDQVKSIRSDTRTLREISKEYGVGTAQVSRIRNHKQWKETT